MFTINIPILHSAIQVFRAHSHQSPFSICRHRPALSLLESRQIPCSLGIFIFSWSHHACLAHHSIRPMDRSSFTMAPIVSDFTECCRLNPKIPPPALLQELRPWESQNAPHPILSGQNPCKCPSHHLARDLNGFLFTHNFCTHLVSSSYLSIGLTSQFICQTTGKPTSRESGLC